MPRDVRLRRWVQWFLVLAALSDLKMASAITLQVSASLPSPQSVGTSVVWTTTANDPNPGTLDYQMSARPSGTGPFQVKFDFDLSNVFTWTPTETEGSFDIRIVARNQSTLQTASQIVTYQIAPLASGTAAVNYTNHPLVALYSAPACPQGSSIRVAFEPPEGGMNYTNFKPCTDGLSTNFLVAGMRASTVYTMRHQVATGSLLSSGTPLSFKTRAIPSTVPFPTYTFPQPPNSQSSLAQGILLLDQVSQNADQVSQPTAIDLKGNVIWYYGRLTGSAALSSILTRTVAGGTMLIVLSEPGRSLSPERGRLLREFDLAGNPVRETNVARVNELLMAKGLPKIDSFHHEARRLANGHTLVLASLEKLYPPGTQGSQTGQPVDILGSAILDLDQNLKVAWFWNPFSFMDVNRAAILGETCSGQAFGCPILHLASQANDWMHANSLQLISSDGNLLLSVRNQDWIIKINYANGTGDGSVLWRMGPQGDFTMTGTSDPYPWFTHQHDAQYDDSGAQTLSLFDNGNTRAAQNPGVVENSRGQVLSIDETNKSVSLTLNFDTGTYSVGIGSAQKLVNGNYCFNSGWINPGPGANTQVSEVLPSGALNFLMQSQVAATYRAFRLSNFYQGDPTGL